jgi:ATP-dependent DNA helicase PIF1
MLNEMRFGNLTRESIQRFKSLERPIYYGDGIAATELFPRREDVERSNRARLEELNTDGWSYAAADGGALQDRQQREKLLSNFMAPQSIYLKVDAQVMLIKNVDETLVNGSMGKVIGFCHRIEYTIDSSGRWREGGLFDEIEVEGDDEVDEKRQRLKETLKSKINAAAKPYPVVRFNVPGGQRDMLVEPDTFKTEQANGECVVSRTQVPLILAWAMSIHKAQGQSRFHIAFLLDS